MGDFNTPLSLMEGHPEQKLNRETTELTDYMSQMDICRTFRSNTKEYIFISAPHGTVSKMDHIHANKSSLNGDKKIEINPCILPDQNKSGLKLDLNNDSNNRKPTNS